ncbi:aminotransferase class I/II-fold pyridoxal phosphate-dependent enzyme [Halomonas campisalis]|nr:aminotransferase class I/II-fold pyridoxal phosphate-dependent enzyme [Halomonas campisalis]MDR5863351.1 aminotransferase class I/II-fold pyridoxal phosphate-dependent enzyme [Halomonas campisalis]
MLASPLGGKPASSPREEDKAYAGGVGAGEHPIVPVMLHDAATAGRFADAMLEEGIYVIAFSYPVVPQGKARIRTQMSAALSREDLEYALAAFGRVKERLGL